MTQPTLFDDGDRSLGATKSSGFCAANEAPPLPPQRYPETPGAKSPGTSQAAADSMREAAPTLRSRALDALRCHGPLTADEIAVKLGETVLAVRPRVTELLRMGLIEDGGLRRKNASGRSAVVWRVA